MKRSKFIGSLLLAASAPLVTVARNRRKYPGSAKGFKTPKSEGRIHGHLQLKGVNSNILDLKVSGSDTDGGIAIFEQTSLSQGRGTPLHIHPHQDETFYIVAGSYFFQVGDDRFHGEAGDTIFFPQNVPHAWTQESATGKMVVIFQPAGKMEQFFTTVAALETEPTKEEMAKLFETCDMKIVGPVLKIE